MRSCRLRETGRKTDVLTYCLYNAGIMVGLGSSTYRRLEDMRNYCSLLLLGGSVPDPTDVPGDLMREDPYVTSMHILILQMWSLSDQRSVKSL